MMQTQFTRWRLKNKRCSLCNDTEDNFSIFFHEQFVDKDLMEIMSDMAYQIYQMQVCIDGLIEDQEHYVS